MPTKQTQTINGMIDAVRKGIALGMNTTPDGTDIPVMLKSIEEACNGTRPVYHEGLARMHMCAGDYFYERSPSRAISEYIFAIETSMFHPFHAASGDEQGQMLERALWRRFELALKLGDIGSAIQAAEDALDGLDYVTAKNSDDFDGSYTWGPVRRARVHGLRRRYKLGKFLLKAKIVKLSSPSNHREVAK